MRDVAGSRDNYKSHPPLLKFRVRPLPCRTAGNVGQTTGHGRPEPLDNDLARTIGETPFLVRVGTEDVPPSQNVIFGKVIYTRQLATEEKPTEFNRPT